MMEQKNLIESVCHEHQQNKVCSYTDGQLNKLTQRNFQVNTKFGQ